jgi:hypothetical protein
MIIPADEIIIQQQHQRNFEQICESIKNLDIQQQSNVNNNIQQQQHYPVVPPVETISKLPSINELLDYQLLVKRIKELEINSHLQNQEIEYLRKENSELNEKLSLLVQVEVNIQLESKLNQLNQEFDRYKEELKEKFSRYTNDVKVVNDFLDLDNQEDRMVFDDNNTLESKSHQSTDFQAYYPMNVRMQIGNDFNVNNNDDDNKSNFGNIHRELQNIANGFNDDRDSWTERMNSLRNMIYLNQNQ